MRPAAGVGGKAEKAPNGARGACRMTWPTRWAAVRVMRRALTEGKKPRRSQLKANSLSWPQSPQSPQRSRGRGLRMRGRPELFTHEFRAGLGCSLFYEGRRVLRHPSVQRGPFQSVALEGCRFRVGSNRSSPSGAVVGLLTSVGRRLRSRRTSAAHRIRALHATGAPSRLWRLAGRDRVVEARPRPAPHAALQPSHADRDDAALELRVHLTPPLKCDAHRP